MEVGFESNGAIHGFLRDFIDDSGDFKGFAVFRWGDGHFDFRNGRGQVAEHEPLIDCARADRHIPRGGGGALRAGEVFRIGNSPHQRRGLNDNIPHNPSAHWNRQQGAATGFAQNIDDVVEPARGTIRDHFHTDFHGVGCAADRGGGGMDKGRF